MSTVPTSHGAGSARMVAGNAQTRCREETVDRGRHLATAAKLAALFQLVTAADPSPVAAIERAWKPRRHHRRLGEGDTSRPIYDSYSHLREKTIQNQLKTKVHHRKVKKRRTPKFKEYHLSAKNPEDYRVLHEIPWSGSIRRGVEYAPFGIPLIVIVGMLFFLLGRIREMIGGWKRRERTEAPSPKHGKWIYDRSLGGKETFVATEGVDWNPLGQQNVLRGSGKEVRNATFVLPSWWKSRSYIYVDEHRKEEAKEEVRKILKQLNDLRISGRDYRFDLIVELYRICTDSCIAAKTSRNNVAASIYRYAVDCTIRLIADGIGLSYGVEPLGFLCQLAEIMGVDAERAISIIDTAMASKIRAGLLQVFVNVRSDDTSEVSVGQGGRSVIRLLTEIPLSAGAAELVGSSITTSTTEQERIQVYEVLRASGPQFEDLIGTLLGRYVSNEVDAQ